MPPAAGARRCGAAVAERSRNLQPAHVQQRQHARTTIVVIADSSSVNASTRPSISIASTRGNPAGSSDGSAAMQRDRQSGGSSRRPRLLDR